jgi:hypothetical protein
MTVGLYPGAMNRREETVSRAYLHCAVHEQRLRRLVQAAIFPGSRKRAPGTLRSQRGLPYNIHNRRTDLSVLECRRPWPCQCKLCRQKPLRSCLWLRARYRKYLSFLSCNRLEAGAEHSSPLLFNRRKGAAALRGTALRLRHRDLPGEQGRSFAQISPPTCRGSAHAVGEGVCQ